MVVKTVAFLLRGAVVVEVWHDDGRVDDDVGGYGLRIRLLLLHDGFLKKCPANAARLCWDGYA